jgi:hypothetical protein
MKNYIFNKNIEIFYFLYIPIFIVIYKLQSRLILFNLNIYLLDSIKYNPLIFFILIFILIIDMHLEYKINPLIN